MSGRLIILPKKSYCPWKPENIERVLRDERLDREQRQHEHDVETKASSQRKLSELRSGSSGVYSGGESLPSLTSTEQQQQQQHIHLFENAKQDLLDKVHGKTTLECNNDSKKRRRTGIMPVMLGGTALKTQGQDKPFYLRPAIHDGSIVSNRTSPNDHLSSNGNREEKRKARLDPTRAFMSTGSDDTNNKSVGSVPSSLCTDLVVRHDHQDDGTSRHHVEGTDTDSESDKSTATERHRQRKRRRNERKLRKESNTDTTNGIHDSQEGESEKARKRRKKKKHRRIERKNGKKEAKKDKRRKEKQQLGTSRDELRKRRAEREAQEAQREAHILSRSVMSDDRSRQYQNQYNPSLSRR